jgi:hypothetical protein
MTGALFDSRNRCTFRFPLTDVEGTVAELKASGMGSFEHYDLPGTTRDGDIHRAGEVKMAWFKDPSGNIFEINGR